MQVHRILPESRILEGCALTTGTFDGVHRGHQKLVSTLNAEAHSRGLQSVGLTFEDMPICVLRPEVCPPLLTLAEEKIAAFEQTALDHLFIVPFTRAIAAHSAHQWMQKWAQCIGLKLFVGGPDFALGRNREGTIAQLGVLGREMGFEVMSLGDKLLQGDRPISSTRTRQIIERGQVERAPEFLGRFYRMSGRVVSGQQLGRTLGFPTINLRVNKRKCLPGYGVYAVRVYWEGESFPAVLNSGMRPTVGGTDHQIEFHVLDRVISQAPVQVEVEFVSRLRDEIKFKDVEALRLQLQGDVREARLRLHD